MRFLPASDRAVLVELDDLPQALALYRQLLQSPRAARWQRRIFGGFFMALGTGLLFVQRHRQG